MSVRAHLTDEQPSVARAVWLTRVVGSAAAIMSVCVSLIAWYTGTVAWLIAYLASFLALSALITWLSSIPRRRQKELDREWAGSFHELAIRDELTGLYNRRFFNQELARLVAESHANTKPLTLALIDLNDFKSINDTYGHHTGDAALRLVAECIRAAVSENDITARTGGDEFAVIIPNATPGRANAIVSSIRATLDLTPVLHSPLIATGTHVRAAVGLAEIATGTHVRAAIGLAEPDEFNEIERLLRQADSELYENKRELRRLNDRRRAS